MKKFTLLFCFFMLANYSVVTQAAALPDAQVIKLNQRIYAMLGPAEVPSKANRGYMANTTFIIGDKGVILIDTGFSHEIGQHLKESIKKITNKPVTHIINTHDHGDHVLGNNAFPDATIISSEKCQTAMETTAYEWMGLLEDMTGLTFPETKPAFPTVVYKETTHTMTTLQGVKLELWVPHGSHTSNDLMVYLAQDKVLIAGDILVNTMMPSFRDGHIKNWIHTLDEISQLPLEKIVPGHGKLMTIKDVKEMHHAMSALYTAVEAGYRKGLMDNEIRKTLDLSYWQKHKHFDDFMGSNINRTYLEVENANF